MVEWYHGSMHERGTPPFFSVISLRVFWLIRIPERLSICPTDFFDSSWTSLKFFITIGMGSAMAMTPLRTHKVPEKNRYGCNNSILSLVLSQNQSQGLGLYAHLWISRTVCRGGHLHTPPSSMCKQPTKWHRGWIQSPWQLRPFQRSNPNSRKSWFRCQWKPLNSRSPSQILIALLSWSAWSETSGSTWRGGTPIESWTPVTACRRLLCSECWWWKCRWGGGRCKGGRRGGRGCPSRGIKSWIC